MKKTIILLLSAAVALCLAGCCFSHEWADATCTAPKTCTKCEKTEGEALGHAWKDATCSTRKTCSVCSAVEGEYLPHSWIDATCSTPRTCSVCSKTSGKPIAHSWEWTVTSEPGYCKQGAKSGICSVCGETTEEKIDELVPEYTWNKSVTLEMPLDTVTVGIYQNGSEYWIEFRSETMDTMSFLAFFANSTSNWGFTTDKIANRLQKVLDMYDKYWVQGTVVYASMEGFGIKWTTYLEMNENVPAVVGLKVNKLNEFTAVFDGVIKE